MPKVSNYDCFFSNFDINIKENKHIFRNKAKFYVFMVSPYNSKKMC